MEMSIVPSVANLLHLMNFGGLFPSFLNMALEGFATSSNVSYFRLV